MSRTLKLGKFRGGWTVKTVRADWLDYDWHSGLWEIAGPAYSRINGWFISWIGDFLEPP